MLRQFYPHKPKPPFIFIVGAGPGDPGLITLRCHELITSIADVVVYDRLIPEDIINLIPSHIKKIYAGKSCRKHVMTQEEINQCLVDEANDNQVVVRLKGGDPFIFGRGGEEVAFLNKRHIPLEIIPGINAADGCAAFQGIPLTHRGVASSVRFITGHQQKGQPTLFNWKELADLSTTLVIFMGLANLSHITDNLISAGLPKDTPVAAIQNGTTPNERCIISTLDHISCDVTKEQLAAPSIIIIGNVVSLRKVN